MNASSLVRRFLGEAQETTVDKDKPLPVIEATRPVTYHVCPHCKNEIYEKHTYIDGDFMSGNYVDRHSDCKGAINFPPPSAESLAWLEKFKNG